MLSPREEDVEPADEVAEHLLRGQADYDTAGATHRQQRLPGEDEEHTVRVWLCDFKLSKHTDIKALRETHPSKQNLHLPIVSGLRRVGDSERAKLIWVHNKPKHTITARRTRGCALGVLGGGGEGDLCPHS